MSQEHQAAGDVYVSEGSTDVHQASGDVYVVEIGGAGGIGGGGSPFAPMYFLAT